MKPLSSPAPSSPHPQKNEEFLKEKIEECGPDTVKKSKQYFKCLHCPSFQFIKVYISIY